MGKVISQARIPAKFIKRELSLELPPRLKENREDFLVPAKQSIKQQIKSKNLAFNLILTTDGCSPTSVVHGALYYSSLISFCAKTRTSSSPTAAERLPLALGDTYQMYLPQKRASQDIQCHWLQEKTNKNPGSFPTGPRLDRNSSSANISNKRSGV